MKKRIWIFFFVLLVVHCTLKPENSYSQAWSTLGSGMNHDVYALTVYNNELIAGGYFVTAGNVIANNIARWNGTSWLAFGTGASDIVYAVSVYNNDLIAAGSFSTIGGVNANHIARWNGTTWAPLGSGVNQGVSALTVYNNELIVAGEFTTAGGISANRIAKWNGSIWAPLGSGTNDVVWALTVYNNELIVGGGFDSAGGVAVNGIAKWNGTTWAPLGSGVGSGFVYALTVYNNQLVAGGYFPTAGGVNVNNIAKWNGTSWSTVDNGTNSAVNALTVYNNELIVGGDFERAGQVNGTYKIAKWNGASWLSLGGGIGYSVTPYPKVYCLNDYSGTLIVGGSFILAGGIPVNYIARWGNVTFSISGQVRYADNNLPATNGYVKAFRYESSTGKIIVVDSAQIQLNGSYVLNNIPQVDLYIGAVPNSSPPADYVLTYFPSTIYWQSATLLHPIGSLTDININVYRLTSFVTLNHVGGKVNSANPVIAPLKDANLYAKFGNYFVGYSSSNSNGNYIINTLPSGTLEIIADRMGYQCDSVSVNLASMHSSLDSVNFYLIKLPIGIKTISSEVPSKFMLYQNYPNPFNPTTNIRFQVKEKNFITLKIFNILGKEIATLVNEKKSPGTYEVRFNAGNLPSGVYFYKLSAGEFTDTRRLLLLK